jgi:hypothetical protein
MQHQKFRMNDVAISLPNLPEEDQTKREKYQGGTSCHTIYKKIHLGMVHGSLVPRLR